MSNKPFQPSPLTGAIQIYLVEAILMIAAFSLHPDLSISISIISVIFNFGLLIYLFYCLIKFGVGENRSFLFVMSLSFVMIFSTIIQFALLFVHTEIRNSAGVELDDFGSALYFSIVTWTSLGYGDIAPVNYARIVAMTEVMFGYMVMALLIAAFAAAIQGNKKAPEAMSNSRLLSD
ncbi:MAG: potassium channel family protein [Micropepsaceae bacterium]